MPRQSHSPRLKYSNNTWRRVQIIGANNPSPQKKKKRIVTKNFLKEKHKPLFNKTDHYFAYLSLSEAVSAMIKGMIMRL
jgi:hypothetical protein